MRMVAELYARVLSYGPKAFKWFTGKALDEAWEIGKQIMLP